MNKELKESVDSAKIILFTNNFPFRSGEEFLRSEIDYVQKNKIPLCIISYGKIAQDFLDNDIKVNSFSLKKHYYIRGLIRASLSLFSKDVFSEIHFAFKNIPHFRLNKNDILALIQFRFVFYRIEHFLRYNKINLSSKVIYTYWTGAIAYFFVKSRMVKFNIKISRAHADDIYINKNYLPFRREIMEGMDNVYFSSELGRNINIEFFRKIDSELIDKMLISRLGTKKVLNSPNKILNKKFYTFLSVSSINDNKRLDLIINALALQDYPIKWIHIGSGPLMGEMFDLANEKLSGKVDFLFKGYLKNEQVIEFMLNESINYFINLSDSEGVPVSIMEAMSCGIPCIARNVGAISEIVVNNTNGILIDSDCIDEIGSKINKLMEFSENKQDIMRQNAYETWNNLYSSETNYGLFYDELLIKSR